MKPVPISQYLDHIGRTAQTDSQAPRRDASPFRPRAVRMVSDQEPEPKGPLTFNRVLREAAAASRARSLGLGLERPEPEARALRIEVEPEPPQPDPEVEARVAEAYHRGLHDGATDARAEAAETASRHLASQQDRLLVERLDFQMNEYAQLADAIASGLGEIEQRIAASVGRILAPFLTNAVTNQVVDELCASLARLSAGGAPGLIKIRGPERLLKILRERVASLPVEVEYIVENGVEATIEAQHTMIRSELQSWADLIASLEG
jgi:hypothetical protein